MKEPNENCVECHRSADENEGNEGGKPERSDSQH
jgi:hypothetical protein